MLTVGFQAWVGTIALVDAISIKVQTPDSIFRCSLNLVLWLCWGGLCGIDKKVG